jgi:hypothetical protein
MLAFLTHLRIKALTHVLYRATFLVTAVACSGNRKKKRIRYYLTLVKVFV